MLVGVYKFALSGLGKNFAGFRIGNEARGIDELFNKEMERQSKRLNNVENCRPLQI